MGLGPRVATALCEHAVLTHTVGLAWPKNTPKQTWSRHRTDSDPHDLLQVKRKEDLEKVKTVMLDLTQLVFAFPRAGCEWMRSHSDLPSATFEGKTLEEALKKCLDGGFHVGTVNRLAGDHYVINVDTFTDEMLVGFLFDRLLNVRRGLIGQLPNLVAAYYLMDGERPAAKSTTTKKRSTARCYGQDYKIHQRVATFLGPDRAGLLELARIRKDGQEMWQGSLFDYLSCRENLWRILDRLGSMVERVGERKEHDVDVFVARGWHSSRDSSAQWFRLAGNRPESTRPLRDYYNSMVDLEADAMMIRLGRLAVDHLKGSCLLSTTDSDVVVSLISLGSPYLFWTKQLAFKDSKDVVVRTESKGEERRMTMTPPSIDLRSLNPLKEPAICKDYLLWESNNFLFSSCEFSEWSLDEAERRLCAIFVVLLGGCDFCENLEKFGARGIVGLLSKKPKLCKVRFSRITFIENVTGETEQGMRHECLRRLDNKVRFPWRCGDFVCLVEVDFSGMKMLIQTAVGSKPIDGRDWRPFIRRLCYSVMTLSATGVGLEGELRDNAQLSENFGYDSQRDFEYIRFEDEEYRSVGRKP